MVCRLQQVDLVSTRRAFDVRPLLDGFVNAIDVGMQHQSRKHSRFPTPYVSFERDPFDSQQLVHLTLL